MFIVEHEIRIWLSLWPWLLFTVTKIISYLLLLLVSPGLCWLLVLGLVLVLLLMPGLFWLSMVKLFWVALVWLCWLKKV